MVGGSATTHAWRANLEFEVLDLEFEVVNLEFEVVNLECEVVRPRAWGTPTSVWSGSFALEAPGDSAPVSVCVDRKTGRQLW